MRNRFFYAPDAGAGASAAAPAVVVDGDNPDDFAPQFGDSIAVVDDASNGPSKEDLQKLFDAQKAELEALKAKEGAASAQAAPFAALADSISKLSSRPVQVNTPPPQQPGESFDTYRSRVESQFIEKPFETIQEVVNRSTGPAFEALASQTAKLAKRTAMSDSGDREFWGKHAEEIDSLGASLTPQERLDPEAYTRIYDVVRGRHVDELLAAMQAKAATTGGEGGNPAAQATPAASPTSSSPLAGGGASSDGKIHITRADAAAVQDYMLQQCIPESQFERVVLSLRERGILRRY